MADMADTWEYLTLVLTADIKSPGAQEYLQSRWPGQQFNAHTPRTLAPELNELGRDRWELVHIEPIEFDRDGDADLSGHTVKFTHTYFCVLKRPVRT